MSELKRARIRIGGRVQGVYYRYSASQKAKELGVRGWVRNLPDGTVEALVEGPERNIDELIGWCRKGPSGAAVDSVDVSWEPYTGEFHSFQIRY